VRRSCSSTQSLGRSGNSPASGTPALYQHWPRSAPSQQRSFGHVETGGMRPLAFALAAAILTAGILSPTGSAAKYRDLYVSFRYPDSWHVYHWPIPSPTIKYIAWLSNARLHDPCIRQRTGIQCTRPIERLPPKSVLLTWRLVTLLRADSFRSGVWITRPGSCGEVGADETITRRFHGYVVEACIRGPAVARTQRQVLKVLRSARFTTG